MSKEPKNDEDMIEPKWTISPIEFLNNLDTL